MVAHAYKKQEFKASLSHYKTLCKKKNREEGRVGVREEKETRQKETGKGKR